MQRALLLLVLLLALFGSWMAFEGLSAPGPQAAVPAGPGRRVHAELEGGATAELEDRDVTEGAQRSEVEQQAPTSGELELEAVAAAAPPDPGVLIATLIDAAGAPIVGAELGWPRRDNIEPAVSDEAGVARLELPGQYLTRWRGQDYASSFEIVAAGFATHRFRSTAPPLAKRRT